MDIDALLRKAASAWQMDQQQTVCENCAEEGVVKAQSPSSFR
jgi:hypothetical protein